MTASAQALDGPQGCCRRWTGSSADFGDALDDLGSRWEILDTGITVKLYPSCAGTHPSLDAVLDLRRANVRRGRRRARRDRRRSITPTILIHDRPATGLEGKFSMPFCAASAIVHGAVGIETFDDEHVRDERVRALMPRIHMRADPALDGVAAALTQARVAIQLRDGRVVSQYADGARGYPTRPRGKRSSKGSSCAAPPRAVRCGRRPRARAAARLDEVDDVRRCECCSERRPESSDLSL